MTGPGDRGRSARWRREGLVLAPPADHAWWRSHAQAPTILPLTDRLWRVYFAAREGQPRSRILCADIDPGDAFRVLRVHPHPVLELGDTGAFDSHGMGPATALLCGDKVHLYYTGIVTRSDIPYQLAIGLGISDDGLHFRRVTDGPLLSTGPRDPLFVTTPCVRPTGDGFEMWYASGVDWRHVDGTLEPFYVLRHTHSADGVIWSLASELALGHVSEQDAGLARPWVAAQADGRRLWYSRRGADRFRRPGAASYRLYQATINKDGMLKASEGPVMFENPPLPSDWDGWMQSYACIQPLGDDLIMLYNGDDFGRGGFGCARLPGGTA